MPTLESSTIIRLTGKQKSALMLRKAGYSDSVIAEKMGITREAANRLINRAKRSEAELAAIVREFLDGEPLAA